MRKKTKLIEGWGVNDAQYAVYKYEKVNGKSKIVWTCPYYADWVSLLQRCISKKVHERRPTYKDCSVCEEWKYFSNFIKWVDSQPNRNWMSCELDKDILINGDKHYSPETCIYIPTSLNTFIKYNPNSRGSYMLGVNAILPHNKLNPYQARCRNPFTGKRII